ncbi:DUF2147 domain-containing protein [Sphingomonas sp.]|uniref:DUF2147 domain-containing protein n=1 Tax=Sphingomonas sp. TaxID=28214 RepID=UPI001B0DF857|nr:DUF2147 domain-containing protein [Sphingomonas sp.]MBO9712526.1 DUF2147 domain-containing protein [Sphingomonas sp.]
MIPAFAALLALAFTPQADPQSVVGVWRTNDGNADVKVDRCGQKMCGTVLRILNPKAPKTDTQNPDASLRNRPMVGLVVLSGYQWKDGGWQGGKAYDAKSGKSYNSSIAVGKDGKLGVTGCVMFICQTRYWTRVK